MRRVAVIGSSGFNVGVAVAADLALAGYAVAFWPGDAGGAIHAEADRRGGIVVEGPPEQLVSGKIGLARPRLTGNAGAAVDGADLIVLDAAPAAVEDVFAAILPALAAGQVVHINTHGYWPALRLADPLRAADARGVTLTEGPTPTHAADYAEGTLTAHALRGNVPVAAFPARDGQAALALVCEVFPNLVPATSVLETNFHSMNMLMHPALALLSITALEKAADRGEMVDIYRLAHGDHSARLTEALDAQRVPVCEAFGVPFTSLATLVRGLYGGGGGTVREAIDDAFYYFRLPPLAPDVWATWLRADVPLAHVPYVALADLCGAGARLNRAMVDVFGALLGEDYWRTGLTLERLGLAGMTPCDVVAYAHDGPFGAPRRRTPAGDNAAPFAPARTALQGRRS